MIVVPTRYEIENRRIAEGTFYDFKREVDLDKKYPGGAKSAKERFVDDVVAFLNGEGGHLIIGVSESDGVWDSYVPLTADRCHWGLHSRREDPATLEKAISEFDVRSILCAGWSSQ